MRAILLSVAKGGVGWRCGCRAYLPGPIWACGLARSGTQMVGLCIQCNFMTAIGESSRQSIGSVPTVYGNVLPRQSSRRWTRENGTKKHNRNTLMEGGRVLGRNEFFL